MATFALIHGGRSTAWDWHIVTPLLESSGHDVVAVDLPTEDENAGFEEYIDTVTAAVGSRRHVIVVGHSLGGFTAPLVSEVLHADGLVYLAAMIPLSGETFGDWWTNTGHDRESINDNPDMAFFNGVPDHLVREARERGRDQQGEWMSQPWPAERHPTMPTRAILCREDQFFPASFMMRQIRDRLGIDPLEIPGGHYAALSKPGAVATALDDFAREVNSRPT